MGGLIARKRAKKPSSKRNSSHTYDVICVGRPSLDIILKGDVFSPICSHGSCYEHIPLGVKLPVETASKELGGNVLNAAVTFARQDLSTALLTQLGTDTSSSQVTKLLEAESIDSDLIYQADDIEPALSVIISAPSGERSVLAYPGTKIKLQQICGLLDDVETRWLYLSSLGSIELLDKVIEYAIINQIKVAFNPGGLELEDTNLGHVKKIFENVDVLILNKQEAAKFFGSGEAGSLCRAGAELSSVCVVTDGPGGAYANDGSVDYHQPISEDVKIIDRNGAGDAFASGLIAGLAWGLDLKESLLLGSRNSTSVVQQIGAQNGILRRQS